VNNPITVAADGIENSLHHLEYGGMTSHWMNLLVCGNTRWVVDLSAGQFGVPLNEGGYVIERLPPKVHHPSYIRLGWISSITTGDVPSMFDLTPNEWEDLAAQEGMSAEELQTRAQGVLERDAPFKAAVESYYVSLK